MDMLSEAMGRVQFRSLVPGVAELTAPWGIRFPRIGPGVPPPEHVPPDVHALTERSHLRHVGFHAVLDGRCTSIIEPHEKDGRTAAQRIDLVAGDLLILTRHVEHRLCDDVDSPCRNLFDVLPKPSLARSSTLKFGGAGGAATSLLFGVFLFRGDLGNRFVNSLPLVMHLRGDDGRARAWLPDVLRLIKHEASHLGPGSAIIVDRLASILFCQAVREHFTRRSDERGVDSTNWLRACMDEAIGPAMAALHERPAKPWTVESLAAEVAMSRSSFASRFAARVGVPPLQYLADLRMTLACEALTEGDESIKSIARAVGYSSEAAFSTAFRRAIEMSPIEYRRMHVRFRERLLAEAHSPDATPTAATPTSTKLNRKAKPRVSGRPSAARVS
jgi:AraC-like DNA-binding protein